MNIVQRYLGLGIEGYSPSDLLKIFNGDHKIKVKYASGGIVALDNGNIIKCVGNYYINPGHHSVNKSKKVSNTCYYVQKELGVDSNTGNYQCLACHRACIGLNEDNSILRR
jgi:hypothetical protein